MGEKEAETFKLSNLQAAEEVVTEHSRTLAKQYGVRPEHYRIVLDTHCKEGDRMKLRGGPVVEIWLPWPAAVKNMNDLLGAAFHLISSRKLVEPMALQPIAHVLRHKNAMKQWYREKYGDEAEIFADLLPRKRIRSRTDVTRRVTLTDRDTGISVEVVDTSGKRYERDMFDEARIKLSRVVRMLEEAQGDTRGQRHGAEASGGEREREGGSSAGRGDDAAPTANRGEMRGDADDVRLDLERDRLISGLSSLPVAWFEA